MPLLALIVLFFFLELFLIVMAAVEHGWPVFWFEVATTVLGVLVIRRNQEITMREMFGRPGMQTAMSMNFALVRGARAFVCGLLLILPGFITDGIGLVLLVLPGLYAFLFSLLKIPMQPPADPPRTSRSGGGRVVEGEAKRIRKGTGK